MDPAAFEATVEPALPRLALWVRRRGAALLGPDCDDEDVVQEVLVKAWRLFEGFEPRGPEAVFSWLAALAEGVLCDRSRYRAAKGRGEVRHLESRHGTDGAPADAPSTGTSITRLTQRREARRVVEAAIAALAPGQREVVELHLIDGQSLGEIARALGVTKNAVWERLRRGLVHVRDAVPEGLL